jgi:hypothetical protein
MRNFLFIPSIQAGDWHTLYVKCAIVLFFWVLMIVAVLLDLWSGLDRARTLKEKPRSDKFRRTVEKIGDYWRLLAFGLIIDFIASMLPFYTIPYASMLSSVACILIELKSVIENSRAKKSAAAQLPEVIMKIISCKNSKEAIELIKKIHELSEKHGKNEKEL